MRNKLFVLVSSFLVFCRAKLVNADVSSSTPPLSYVNNGTVAYRSINESLLACTSTTDELYTSGFLFEKTLTDISVCASLCFEYNLHDHHSDACLSFEIVESISTDTFACKLTSCHYEVMAENAVVNTTIGWLDTKRTPGVKGIFQNDEELSFTDRIELQNNIGCRLYDNYTILIDTSVDNAIECQHRCTHVDECMGFVLSDADGCTLKNHCFKEEFTSDDALLYTRIKYDDDPFNTIIGKSCLAGSQSNILSTEEVYIVYVNETVNTTVSHSAYTCRLQCENNIDCNFFEIDEFGFCHQFTSCNVPAALLPEYTYWERITPDTNGEICSDSHECMYNGLCDVNTRCKCSYPHYGEVCQYIAACVSSS